MRKRLWACVRKLGIFCVDRRQLNNFHLQITKLLTPDGLTTEVAEMRKAIAAKEFTIS